MLRIQRTTTISFIPSSLSYKVAYKNVTKSKTFAAYFLLCRKDALKPKWWGIILHVCVLKSWTMSFLTPFTLPTGVLHENNHVFSISLKRLTELTLRLREDGRFSKGDPLPRRAQPSPSRREDRSSPHDCFSNCHLGKSIVSTLHWSRKNNILSFSAGVYSKSPPSPSLVYKIVLRLLHLNPLLPIKHVGTYGKGRKS